MKEKYFTRQNLAGKAKEIKKEAELAFGHPKFEFTAKNSALLVIDMQKFFSETSSNAFIPSFEAITPVISSLIEKFKGKSLPVIFTKHVNTHDNASLMGKWWRSFLEDGEYTSIVADFDTEMHTVMEKSQYDAFYESELEGILKKFGVENLVVTGVMTHLCCETTARSAFVRGFKTFFTVDGTATYNEGFHRNTIMNLSHGFAVPVLTEEIRAALEGKPQLDKRKELSSSSIHPQQHFPCR